MNVIPKERWHDLSTSEVMALLETNVEQGLHSLEVQRRQQHYGSNALTQKKGKGPLIIFLEQFNQPLIYILLAAAAITGLLREWVDMTVILAVIVINAVVGFLQESKAVKVMEALTQTMPSKATVIREGQKQQILATDLVPGDIVYLQSGDRVPADLRLLNCRNLQIDESALTGESVPAEKQPADQLPLNTPLADRYNMAQSSTLVTYGIGTGVVTVIGDRTEIGRIKEMVVSAEILATPLTRQIEHFSLVLTKVILGIAGLTLVAALLNGYSLEDAFLGVVALAVGAVPEGLPVVVTITLAIGVSRMSKRNAIVRKLPVVETLGSTTVICSDKTGTLTQNEMTVQEVLAGSKRYSVSGVGYDPTGDFSQAGNRIQFSDHQALYECLRAGLLCNDSRLVAIDGSWRAEGDPTEAALIASAQKAGFDRTALDLDWPRMDAIPFESQYQFMATLHSVETGQWAYLKGSVESLLSRCHAALDTTGYETALDVESIHQCVHEMADRGLRVLAFARIKLPAGCDRITPQDVSSKLTFLGLQGMIDPPRPEAVEAVRTCQAAGIQVKMITGDHITTALAVGRQVGLGGLLSRKVLAMSGQEIEALSDQDLIDVAHRTAVFARVAPEQKLRLVKALQARGHVVAMTGDGVNDAPALRQADIGIAMGNSGTEVAKEAADMVLLDDNFATIQAAVEEGRRIYDNIIKSIVWLLPTNASLGLIIVVTAFLGLGVPVTPLQILWINTIAAVLLGTMLAFEVPEPGIMQRPPRPPRQPLLNRVTTQWILAVGVLLCAVAFTVYRWELIDIESANPIPAAQASAVNAIVFGQIFLLFSCRSLRYTMFKLGVCSNRWLLLGVGLMTAAQLLFTYTPAMNLMFKTAPIVVTDWWVIIAASLTIYLLIEGEKWLRRR